MTGGEHREHDMHGGGTASLTRTAALATAHCLTGCAIGEVLGLVIGTAFGLSNAVAVVLAIVLAFFFGYSLTMLPLLRSGLALAAVVPLAFASDTFSIAVMEIVDNTVMVTIPGAMDAGLGELLFWGSLGLALAIAFVAALPVNRYLIARGQGHAVVHDFHHGHGASAPGAAPSTPSLKAGRLAAIGLAAIAFTVGVGIAGATIAGHGGGQDMEHETQHGSIDGVEDAAMPSGHMQESSGDGGHGGGAAATAASGLSASEHGYRLELAPARLERGRVRRLSLRVVDRHGSALIRMDKHGGVRLHLIVVRRDLASFQHVHPKLTPGGEWKIDLLLPDAGRYRAFADFSVDGRQTVLGRDLFVAGRFAPRALPKPEPATTVNGYRVELDGHSRARVEGELAFTVERDGARARLEPYLGADGHLVALREVDLAYLHVHPMAATEEGRIRFMATFPSRASYRLFLQFNDGDRVHTAPFTLQVE